LKRDVFAARQWWERIQAKEPTSQDEDFWEAECALGWTENNLDEANEAWNKGNILAQKYPKAGAYEFNRYCFFQRRQALDGAAADD